MHIGVLVQWDVLSVLLSSAGEKVIIFTFVMFQSFLLQKEKKMPNEEEQKCEEWKAGWFTDELQLGSLPQASTWSPLEFELFPHIHDVQLLRPNELSTVSSIAVGNIYLHCLYPWNK